MKLALYWIGALLLIMTLLLAVMGLAGLVMTHHLPFHRVWGGFIVLVGLVCIVAGKISPSSLWKPRWRGSSGAVVSPGAAQMANVFGLAFVAGGAVYGVTGDVIYLLGALFIFAAYVSVVRSSDSPV
jgi:hypothetical protein